MQNELQKAIYQILAASLPLQAIVGARIFDEVPQGAAFPYVVIGDDDLKPWDLDCKRGFEALITIHAFSRYKGRKEAKEIGAKIYDLLHNASIVTDNFASAVCVLDMQTTMVEGDGVTRHLVARFRADFLKTGA